MDRIVRGAWIAVAAAIAAPVAAADFCVGTSAQLQQALTTASANGQDDLIRVRTGSYEAPAGGFVMHEAAGENGRRLAVSGGWRRTEWGDCSERSDDPRLTVFDGNGLARVADFALGGDSSLRVELLTILKGYDDADKSCGGGLRVVSAGKQPTGTVVVERNWFLVNEATMGGGLCVVGAQRIDVVGNVVVANNAFEMGGGIHVASAIYDGATGHTRISNNTVIYNTAGWHRGGIAVWGGSTVLVANNLAWDNTAPDIAVAGTLKYVDLLNNDYQTLIGFPDHSAGNIAVAPVFDSGWFNYTPAAGTALVDAGTNKVYGDLYLTKFDAHGLPRVVGKQVDIGALEAQPQR